MKNNPKKNEKREMNKGIGYTFLTEVWVVILAAMFNIARALKIYQIFGSRKTYFSQALSNWKVFLIGKGYNILMQKERDIVSSIVHIVFGIVLVMVFTLHHEIVGSGTNSLKQKNSNNIKKGYIIV
ncbi:MAG: hypothetical protein KKA79_02215 [Nanoarchaeota archaeon]|nr:hypothetical protein [Nanoarchaeota archaeon]